MIIATLALAATPIPLRVDAVARKAGLAGEILVAKGDRILLDRAYGSVAPGSRRPHKAGARWRLASITKQLVAATIVKNQDLAELDRPFGNAFPQISTLTMRNLLTHHTGLANPDATAASPGSFPAFYQTLPKGLDFCLSKPAVPGAPFNYNNCDYILAAFALPGDWPQDLWPGIVPAERGERGVPGYIAGKPEPDFELWSFATAGGYVGTARAVYAFDRSLMTGKFLPTDKLEALWKPEGNGSYQALGQWVFPGQLKGCAKPKRIVQRDGEIGGVQTRNYILPDDDLVVIVFTNRSSDDFPIGEIWQGKGFAYDLLSAAACP